MDTAVDSPMAFEMEAKQRESQQGGEQQVAAAWWEELDDRGAGLLAGKCHGAASVELRAEAAEPLSFDLGCFVFVFLENLLLPLSILPQLCVGRWRHNLVGKSYFPASKEFASDDELLWALKLTRTGFASSKVHALVFGNTWGMVAAVGYCGVRWWHDAPARYYFLLVLLFQVLLRSQWAIKYAYREMQPSGGYALALRWTGAQKSSCLASCRSLRGSVLSSCGWRP